MADHDILTIEEIAQYLRVSERTVYDWANKGTIPCGKLGTTWRFKRTEVERWVDEKLSSRPGTDVAPQSVTMGDILHPDRIVYLDTDRKAPALNALVDRLGQLDEVKDESALREEIFHREELMSTGIGFNVAVPHVRIDSVTNLVMGVGICTKPIIDFPSLDEEPVRIICMLAARSDQHALYLKTLGVVSAALKPEGIREALLQARDPEAAYLILTQ